MHKVKGIAGLTIAAVGLYAAYQATLNDADAKTLDVAFHELSEQPVGSFKAVPKDGSEHFTLIVKTGLKTAANGIAPNGKPATNLCDIFQTLDAKRSEDGQLSVLIIGSLRDDRITLAINNAKIELPETLSRQASINMYCRPI